MAGCSPRHAGPPHLGRLKRASVGRCRWAGSERGFSFIALSLGWCHASLERPGSESFLYFREPARGMGTGDVTIGLDGAMISLRGIAYLLALSEAPRVLDQDHLETHWREELESLWKGAMMSFEQAAIRQAEPPGIDLGPVDVDWRPRRLSAASNYYFAARSCSLVPFLPQAEALRLARRSESILDQAMREDYPAERERLASVKARWARELRPWRDPLVEASAG